MNALTRRAVFTATRTPVRAAPIRITRRNASGVNAGDDGVEERAQHRQTLAKGARKDPELYVLWVIMAGGLGLAGWYLSRNPTSSSSADTVGQVAHSEPWKTGSDAKYQYHPHGDTSKPRKDAPSALNEVIIPKVNLPRELHEKYNKWGKEGY